jgi:hypothetical protein
LELLANPRLNLFANAFRFLTSFYACLARRGARFCSGLGSTSRLLFERYDVFGSHVVLPMTRSRRLHYRDVASQVSVTFTFTPETR